MKRKLLRLACLVLAIFSAYRLFSVLSAAVGLILHQHRIESDPTLISGGAVLIPIGGTPLGVTILILSLLLIAAISGFILLRPRRKENSHDQT